MRISERYCVSPPPHIALCERNRAVDVGEKCAQYRKKAHPAGMLPEELHIERNCGNSSAVNAENIVFPFSSPHSYCLPLPPLMPTSLSAFVFILCNKGQGRIKELCKCKKKCPFLTKGDITFHIPTGSDSKGK